MSTKTGAVRAVIQRVRKASVSVGGKIKCETGPGLLVLLGIEVSDNIDDINWLSSKIVQLRIFDDANGVMNLSVTETGGSIMIVSQFTLHAKTRKGNRPSYIKAAGPEIAIPLYEKFVAAVTGLMGKETATGEFSV